MNICHPSEGEAPAGCGCRWWRCHGGVSRAPVGNSHPLSCSRAAGAAGGLWVRIIEIFLSLSLSSVAGLKKGPGCRVRPLPARSGLGPSGHCRGCRDVIGAGGSGAGRAAASPRQREEAEEELPMGVWRGRAQLRRLENRETLPTSRGIQPTGAVTASCGCLALPPALLPFWGGAALPPWCRIGLINEPSSWQPHVMAECIDALCHPSSSAFSFPPPTSATPGPQIRQCYCIAFSYNPAS